MIVMIVKQEEGATMTVEERLARIEKRMRQYRACAVVLAGIVGVGLLTGAMDDVTDTLRCRNLEIVNADGTTVGGFFAGSGGGFLEVNSKDGTAVARLKAQKYGGTLEINSEDGLPLVALGANRGSGGLQVADDKGNAGALRPSGVTGD